MANAFEKDEMIGNPDAYRPAEPLGDLLRSIRCTAVIQACAQLSAPWGVNLPQEADAVLVYFVLSGRCVAFAKPGQEVMALLAGDALLVPNPYPHAMADALDTPIVPLDAIVPSELLVAASPDEFLGNLFRAANRYGGGGAVTSIVTLRIFVDKRFPETMLKGLPRLVHLQGFGVRNKLFLEHTIEHIVERGTGGFIGQAVATRLAEALLTACVEDYFKNSIEGRVGLHAGLRDPFLSKALGAILQSPQRDWDIQSLACMAGLSKSAFIKRFSDFIGQTPNDFLLSLRMTRASELLQNPGLSLASIAHDVGYGSEASFNRAFRRWSGFTPGAFRRSNQVRREMQVRRNRD